MLNFDPQGHDPGRVMILYKSPYELYESPSMKVHIYQFLHFYHKVNDLAKIWSLSAGLIILTIKHTSEWEKKFSFRYFPENAFFQIVKPVFAALSVNGLI